ncbi:MAG: hypothetical protein ACRDJY_10055 [Thermoleophilaceae bacterium]
MARKTRVVIFCATCSFTLLAMSGDSAARKPITGKLSARGYTVIALTAGGEARAVRARPKFKVRPLAATVTLHLRARSGKYAGPVVLRRKEKRVVMGVKPGARLGKIKVEKGYGLVAHRPRGRWLDLDVTARARKGVPRGARNLGRVRSELPKRHPRGDRDVDGVPDELDIDDDGDLVIDKLDRSRRGRAAQAPRDPFDLASGMGVPFEQTANVNAGSTDAQIDTVLPEFGYLLLAVPTADSVELDCAALTYCSLGGTGRVGNQAFPACCDGDGDGLGTLTPGLGGAYGQQVKLDHRATSAQIRAGDVLIERLRTGGVDTALTDMHQFIFSTTPALASFRGETGATTTVSYPVSPGAPGTGGNGFTVADGPDAGSEVSVTVTLWRPQRRPTSTSECAQPSPTCGQTEWIDVGGLDYTASSREAQPVDPNGAGWCPQSSFSALGPGLTAGFPDPGGGGFRDNTPSRQASVGNTFTYKLNLTDCLKSYGLNFNSGQTRMFGFEAFTPIAGAGTAGVDNVMSHVSFKRD